MTVLAVVSFGFTFYRALPSLSASVLAPPSPARGRFSISNGGIFGAESVEVECRSNKVVFSNRHTFIANGYITIHEYSAPRIAEGESVTLDCPQPWALHMNEREGVISFGDMVTEVPPPIIVFTIQGDDLILRPPGATPPQKGWIDVSQFTPYPMTSVDASLVVRYRWPSFLLHLSQTRIIHLIGESRGRAALVWRIAPTTEAPIADGLDGFIINANGNALNLQATGRFLPDTKDGR